MTNKTTNEKTDFSHYGTKFQENLAQVMLDDRVFADQIAEVLDLNFLELGYLQLLLRSFFHIETSTARIPLETR